VEFIFHRPQNRLNFHFKVKHTFAYDRNFAFRVGKNNERLAQEPVFNLMHFLETRNIWRFPKTVKDLRALHQWNAEPTIKQATWKSTALRQYASSVTAPVTWKELACSIDWPKCTVKKKIYTPTRQLVPLISRINQHRWFWQPLRCLYWTILRRDRENKERSGNS